MKKLYILFSGILIIGIACDTYDKELAKLEAANPIPDPVIGDAGTLDFSNYISVGNSLSAGFADGALYTDAQNQSFPMMFHQQLLNVSIDAGDFNQANINSQNGFSSMGNDGTINGRFVLNLSTLAPEPTIGEAITDFSGDKTKLNNLAIPGMRMIDINSAALVSNPYYERIAPQPGTSTVLDDAINKNATFFTYWLGNNDILGYVIEGGVDASKISNQGEFQAAAQESINELVSGGAQGIVISLPLLVTIPYLNAVPYNAIALSDPNQVKQLNIAFSSFNQIVDVAIDQNFLNDSDTIRKVNYQIGANPILMSDKDLKNLTPYLANLLEIGIINQVEYNLLNVYAQARPASEKDRPLLTAGAVLGTGPSPTQLIGITDPADDNLILSEKETELLVGNRALFNATIKEVVDGVNQSVGRNVITFLDIQPYFADIAGLTPEQASLLVNPFNSPILETMAANTARAADGIPGIMVNGVNLEPDFSPNGIYSADGIHPNPRGYGIIVNAIINILNKDKETVIPDIDILTLRGVISVQE